MSAVMRKTLKPSCSVMPGWLDRLRPDALGDSAAWIPVQRRRGSTRKQESTVVSDNTKMIRVQGLDLQVRDVGDQHPALVFLHYWGGTGRTGGLVTRELADPPRCVAPDLRGGGGAGKKRGAFSLRTPRGDRPTAAPRSWPSR